MEWKLPLIQLKDISFGYPNCGLVLSGVSLEVNKGDRIALLGGNGAGKTTLFHIMLGLIPPVSGSINIFGKRCVREKDFQEPRRKIGLLFQDPDDQLFSPSVIEDVSFGPLNLGMPRKEALEISRQCLERLGIAHLERRVPYELSGGEKKLVALASVIAMKPRILLLDEPMAGLENRAVERFLSVIQDEDFDAFIIITHLPHLIEHMVNRTLLLKDGRLRPQPSC